MARLRYDGLTQALHWIMAILVIITWAIGLGREGLPKGDLKAWFLMLHMSLGLAILGLMALRTIWRLSAPAVEPIKAAKHVHLAALFTHMGLYILLFAVPVIGLIAAWVKGRSVGFFGLPLPNPFAVDVAYGKFLEGVHEWTANSLIMLAGIHAVAGLFHHYILRDDVLRRMLPKHMG